MASNELQNSIQDHEGIKPTTIDFPISVWKRAKAEAERQGTSLRLFVVAAVDNHLKTSSAQER